MQRLTQAQEDRQHRERLESNSSAGRRADIAGALNKIAAGDASNARVGLSSYLLLMLANQTHGEHIRQLNKAHDACFDRLHPDSRMQRRDAASPIQKSDNHLTLEAMRAMAASAARSKYW